MRSRSVRLTIVILLILGTALAALGFRPINIDIPGLPALERDGAGLLGLKLGLDLSGGGHLVYQADTGSRFDVTLLEPADLEEIAGALQGFRFGDEQLALEDYEVFPRDVEVIQREVSIPAVITVEGDEAPTEDGETAAEGEAPEDTSDAPEDGTEPEEPQTVPVAVTSVFQIRAPLLSADDPRRTGLRDSIEDALGQVDLFKIVDISNPDASQMQGVLDNITRRVNRFGTEEPIIQIFGEDRIIVQLPGASGSTTELAFADPVGDFGAVSDALAGAGYQDIKLERVDDRTFRVLSGTVGSAVQAAARDALTEAIAAPTLLNVSSAIDEAKALIGETALLEFKERTCETNLCREFNDADLGLTGDDLERAEASADPVGIGWVINLQFDGRGSEIFSRLTEDIAGVETKRIAVFMDDREILAPVARAWIRDGSTQISGDFTREEARTLAIQLESGRLQVPLKLIQESDTGPILGAESLRNSLRAGLVGLGLVLVFMVAYYRMAGVVAAFALVFYALMVLAVFKLIPITLELAHIGGFILSVGMAVDANILIFERMKEEVRIGRTLASSMEVGFGRAWPAIRDSNISTMITCLVLLWFGDRLGGGLVTGVAISLFIGVAASMFTAVVVSRNLLQLLAFVGLGQRINLFTPERVTRGPGTGPTRTTSAGSGPATGARGGGR
jgi:preprotein translocase subunit SecD